MRLFCFIILMIFIFPAYAWDSWPDCAAQAEREIIGELEVTRGCFPTNDKRTIITEKWVKKSFYKRVSEKFHILFGRNKEIYLKKPNYHREGAPAVIQLDFKSGVIIHESWHRNGKLHREDGPAIISRNVTTGTVTSEQWRYEGNWHRNDGPAWVSRNSKTGIISSEEWWRNGKLHRKNGPARIWRDWKTGEVTKEEWWLNGEQRLKP